MSQEKKPASNRLLVLACLVPMAGLGACSEHYAAESDSITPDFGATQRWNKSVHVINPSPSYSQNTQILSDGRRIERVINQYSTNSAMPTSGGAASPASSAKDEAGDKDKGSDKEKESSGK